MALIQRSGMWRQVAGPKGAIGDFISVWRAAGPNRWRFAVLAALPPLGIFAVFVNEEMRGNPPPPKIDYITTFDPSRSAAEIAASNQVNQRRKDWLAAEQAKREEEARRTYETIGRLSGMDVDAIKRKAAVEKAAQDQRDRAEADKLRRLQQQAVGTPE